MTAISLVIDRSDNAWHQVNGVAGADSACVILGFSEGETGRKRPRGDACVEKVTLGGYECIRVIVAGRISDAFRNKEELRLTSVSGMRLRLRAERVYRESTWYSDGRRNSIEGWGANPICVGFHGGAFTIEIGNEPQRQIADGCVIPPEMLADECFVRHLIHLANVMFDTLVDFEKQLSPPVQPHELRRSPVFVCRLPNDGGWAYLKRHSRELHPWNCCYMLDCASGAITEISCSNLCLA